MAVLLCAPALTVAQDEAQDDERARLHFQAGTSYFAGGDFEDALREFSQALELSGRAGLHYNIGLCHERLNDLDNAIASHRRFLEASPNHAQAPLAQRRMSDLIERREQQRAGGQGGSPFPLGAAVGFGAAAVGLVLSVAFGLVALSSESDLQACRDTGCPDDDVDALAMQALVSDIGTGVAIAGAAVGVLFLLLTDNDESAVAVSPFVTPNGLSLSFGGHL